MIRSELDHVASVTASVVKKLTKRITEEMRPLHQETVRREEKAARKKVSQTTQKERGRDT